jgi:spore coat polysaccharide biosynthesis protein SpsF
LPRIVASIEARMGSSRLPGKVLADVAGTPALTCLLQRLRRAQTVDDVALATTTSPADDALEAWAREHDVTCVRGSEADVLGRVVETHRVMDTDFIVEVTGDCVMLDPEVIDLGVETFLANDADVVSNTWRPSYPAGVDVQVFRRRDLEAVAAEVADPAVREHVSLFFYEHPDRYRVIHLVAPRRWRAPQLRFQLDYPEDLRFIDEIYTRLGPRHGDAFGLEEITALLSREPDLAEINRHCEEAAVR